MRAPLLIILLWLLFSLSASSSATDGLDDYSRMRLAAEQLVRTQLPSGLFIYAFDFDTGNSSAAAELDGVALVRQSFVAFALAEYAARFQNPRALTAVRRFLDGAARRSLPVGKGQLQWLLEQARAYNIYRLWSHVRGTLSSFGLLYSTSGSGKLLSADGTYESAYPGATALALAAGLRYQEVSGDNRFEKLLGRWVEGLRAVYVPGRGFREAPHYLSESGYLNGEAWLALARYAESYPHDRETAELLERLDDYVLERYRDSTSRQFHHWGSMAAAQRAAMSGDRRFDDFLAGLTRQFLSSNAPALDLTSNTCHVVEGLASSASRQAITEGTDPLATMTGEWIERLMAKNRQLQIRSDMLSRLDHIPQAARHRDFLGGFLHSAMPLRTRVDFTAHCLNALIIMDSAGMLERAR